MRLKFEDWCDESEYTWEVVHNDTHFESHAEPFTYRTFEEWARHYEPIQTIYWDVHFTIHCSIEQIEVNYTINPTDGITVNNAINQVRG